MSYGATLRRRRFRSAIRVARSLAIVSRIVSVSNFICGPIDWQVMTSGTAGVEARIRLETADDHEQVRELHARAFPDEPVIPELVDTLRAAKARLAPTAFVATTAEGRVVGHVLLSAVRLDAPRRIVDVFVLSPLGVLPERQGHGIGTRLIGRALTEADRLGVPLVFLEGSPDYYGKRGFQTASAVGFRRPSLRIPDLAFQVAPLSTYQPWMTGTVVYSEPFWALDCVGLRDPDA
jgi:putative acetyltransferase